MFELSGRGKDGLKFAFEFQASLSHKEETKTKENHNYTPAGTILNIHGTNFGEFSDITEALKDVEHLVAKNQIEFEWTDDMHPPQIDAVNPKYNKYYYVRSDGKEMTKGQITTKQLDGAGQVKDVAALENTLAFIEGLGLAGGDGAPSTVQITNAKYDGLKEHSDVLRTSCLFIYTNNTTHIYIHN